MDFSIVSRTNLVSFPPQNKKKKEKKNSKHIIINRKGKLCRNHFPSLTTVSHSKLTLRINFLNFYDYFTLSVSLYVYLCISLSLYLYIYISIYISLSISYSLALYSTLSTFVLYLHFCLWPPLALALISMLQFFSPSQSTRFL